MTSVIKFSQFANVNLTNTTNMLVGVTSPSGGTNFQAPASNSWTTANRPSPSFGGLTGFNTDLGQLEYWNSSAWVQIAAGGSGSVNSGSVNQLAWYMTSGTAVSGLNTANSSVLTTDSGGAPLWATTLPSSLTVPQPNIQGVTNGSNAIAGSVGELISSVISSGSAINLPNNTPTNVIVLSLSAGDWDVHGNVSVTGSANNINGAGAWISLISASIPDESLYSALVSSTNNIFTRIYLPTPYVRLSLTTTTSVYLSAQAGFSPGSANACGGIYARRIR